MISLCPPRKPTGSAKDRRWTLVIQQSTSIADHIDLYGTHAGDPQGAQQTANEYLGQEHTWTAIGPGFQATPIKEYS
jgi:hypothetical protein